MLKDGAKRRGNQTVWIDRANTGPKDRANRQCQKTMQTDEEKQAKLEEKMIRRDETV